MNFIDRIQDFWWQTLGALFASWVLVRQKYVRDEHMAMKQDIENLKLDHAKLDSTLANVKKNQELMRDVQNEIRADIKTLIGRRTEDKKKGWFF